MMPFMFDLGEIVKDKITGFEGVVMGRTQYFTDCNHYGLLSPKLSSDLKPTDWQWFDERRLERTKKKPIILKGQPTSGPFPNAPEV